MISTIHIQPFAYEFVKPWRSARGILTHRKGWHVKVETQGGLIGIGEAAPMIEAGTESFTACEAALSKISNEIEGLDVQAALEVLPVENPAARCGFETALYNLLDGDFCRNKPSSVRVNAAVGALLDFDFNDVQDGFDVIKLKVATGRLGQEINRLHHLADQIPSKCKIRLDANGGWSFDEAKTFLKAIVDLPIESLEEPLITPNSGDWLKLQALVDFPLALDENLGKMSYDIVRRVVLKPMAQGGPLATVNLGKQAQSRDIETIITTTIDGPVGVRAAYNCAAALDPQNQWCHGIATSHWLKAELPIEYSVKDGRLTY